MITHSTGDDVDLIQSEDTAMLVYLLVVSQWVKTFLVEWPITIILCFFQAAEMPLYPAVQFFRQTLYHMNSFRDQLAII